MCVANIVKQKEKQIEIASMLGQKMSDEQFARLVSLGEKVSDYHDDARNEDDTGFDDDTGVALVFDREDEEEAGMDEGDDNDLDVVREADEDIEEHLEDETSIVRSKFSADVVDADAGKVHPRDVDAYWLQRQLSNYSKDAVETQKLADAALSVLEVRMFCGIPRNISRPRKTTAIARINLCKLWVLTSSSSLSCFA